MGSLQKCLKVAEKWQTISKSGREVARKSTRRILTPNAQLVEAGDGFVKKEEKMLRKTILELNQNLSNEEQIDEMFNQVSAALEEIQNYKISYLLHIARENEEKREVMKDIKESLKEILDFIAGAKDVIDH